MFRAHLIWALFAAVLPCVFAQSGAPAAALPKDPRAILALAAPLYDFASPDMKPWHVKAKYQLYDLNGNPTGQGEWEYWWASPKVHRQSWTRDGLSRGDWFVADGKQFRKESGAPLRYFERQVESALLAPLPTEVAQDANRMKLEVKTVAAGNGSQLTCVSSQLQWMVDGRPTSPDSAVAEDYCFDPPTRALRMKYSNHLITEFNQIARTQGKYLARQVDILAGKLKVFSVTVESVGGIDAADSALTPPADAADVSPEDAEQPARGNVTTGSLVKKTTPVYPMVAKMSRIQGTVILGAVIGKDGSIHDLEVLASPSPLLAKAAVDAVRTWQYKPYLLNGVPVEVETIVNVMFSLGR
ncbi:MAG TPA: energy transducer TonB [Terracidiphilus sp.]|jgi:TonB family protein|nr:energy transducer TonB [Terracidiphilus sp.]